MRRYLFVLICILSVSAFFSCKKATKINQEELLQAVEENLESI